MNEVEYEGTYRPYYRQDWHFTISADPGVSCKWKATGLYRERLFNADGSVYSDVSVNTAERFVEINCNGSAWRWSYAWAYKNSGITPEGSYTGQQTGTETPGTGGGWAGLTLPNRLILSAVVT